MRISHCLIALIVVGTLGAASAPAAGQSRKAERCSKQVSVSEQSFQQLENPARHAYVWVGEIRSSLFGNYDPFDVYVLVGQTFPPFQAPSGRLDRASLDRIVGAAYNTDRFGPLRVTADLIGANRAQLPFKSADRPFTLKVVSVNARAAATELQICW